MMTVKMYSGDDDEQRDQGESKIMEMREGKQGI